jgi:Tol biopolymer transport system component/DNA-binding winged helix-turn-helix (wHTH) protein
MIELPEPPYYFDEVVLDPSNLRLTVAGAVRQLEPKSFRLLQFLIQNRQRVVPKDEVLRVVWEETAVTDNALTRAIAQIRKALDDDPKKPRYIETVPTVGYRFIAELRDVPESAAALPAPAPPRGAKRRSWPTFASAGVAILLAGAVAFWTLGRKPRAPTPPAPPVPLTSYQGLEVAPSFSPDGNQVAFSWNGEKEDNLDVYVKQIGSDAPLRLTTAPNADVNPTWSPDGRSIAFVRLLGESRFLVVVIPALGGPERKLGQFLSHHLQIVSETRFLGYIAWSADSRWLAVAGATDPAGQTDRLYLLSVETGEFSPFTNPSPDLGGDVCPSFSPDGRNLLFVRRRGFAVTEIDRMPLTADLKPAGPPVKYPIQERLARAPAWTADGKDFLFLAESGVWRMPAFGGGPAVRLDWLGRDDIAPTVSARGNRLAFVHAIADTNVWRIDLRRKDAKPERVIASTAREAFPQYSPDGRRIVFFSNRNGSLQIWICEADGSHAFAITSMAGGTGSPRWSPDGQTIVFDSNTLGQWNIYTIGADGGKPRRMTPEAAGANYAASWSHDGRWLYFTSNRSGEAQVWKMPAKGGDAVQVTRNGGVAPIESPDGSTLYYTKVVGAGSIWKMPVGGGLETQLVKSLYRYNYAVAEDGLYFVPRPSLEGSSSIQFLEFRSGAVKTIASIWYPDLGIALSPDGRQLVYAQIDYAASDLMLVENFH